MTRTRHVIRRLQKKSRASGDICKIARSKRNILMSFTWGTNEKMKKKAFRGGGTCSPGIQGRTNFFRCWGGGGGMGWEIFRKKNCAQKYSKKKGVQAVGKKLSKCSLLLLILILDDKKNSCRIYCPVHVMSKSCQT